jgi:RNA polymerase sigma-70 factor, ECF subfamily
MHDISPDLVRLADGDRSAFDPVYRAAWPLVQRHVQRLLAGDAAADDVAQTALLKVFERSHEYDPSRGRAMPWILGIATWECRSERTRRRRESARNAPVHPDLPDPGPGPMAAMEDADLQRELDALLSELPPADRLTLLASAGLVERPNLPAATFRKRVQRALARTRRAWGLSDG